MAQVSLQINGYGYMLGCADGEEEHLRALAADLDRRIEDIKASAGPSGEARLLLMAALVLSDELHDQREQTMQRDGGQRDGGQRDGGQRDGGQRDGGQRDGGSPPEKSEPKSGRRLRGLAKRAEAIADSADAPPLSGPAASEPED